MRIIVWGIIYVFRYKHSTNYCSNTCASPPSTNRCEWLQQLASSNQWTTSNRSTLHQWCSPISRYFNKMSAVLQLKHKLRGNKISLTGFPLFCVQLKVQQQPWTPYSRHTQACSTTQVSVWADQPNVILLTVHKVYQ